MKLSNLGNRQFRGETSQVSKDPYVSLKFVLDQIRKGEYNGRYFTWNDPRSAAGYGRNTLFECDIDHGHLISEIGLLAIQDDYLEHDIEIDLEVQQKHGVPKNLQDKYVEAVGIKKLRHSNNIGSYDDWIAHVDGSVLVSSVPLLVAISSYIISDGSQIILIDRKLKFSELVGLYVHDGSSVIGVVYDRGDGSFGIGDNIS